MTYAAKIVLHVPNGYKPELDLLVAEFIKDQVKFVGVVGPNCSKVEDIIDELCVGGRFKPLQHADILSSRGIYRTGNKFCEFSDR